MVLTDKDVKKLTDHFATKKDLERFATKKDLERFATKADLQLLESRIREDMATKTDLRQFREETFTRLDKVMDELGKIREDEALAKNKDDELERKLDEHGKLIPQILTINR